MRAVNVLNRLNMKKSSSEATNSQNLLYPIYFHRFRLTSFADNVDKGVPSTELEGIVMFAECCLCESATISLLNAFYDRILLGKRRLKPQRGLPRYVSGMIG